MDPGLIVQSEQDTGRANAEHDVAYFARRSRNIPNVVINFVAGFLPPPSAYE